MSVVMTLEERWERLAQASDELRDLAEGALLIAAHEYPGLDIDAYLQRLETLAGALRRRLRPDIGAPERLIALNRYLFEELGFSGNTADFYDPRNSYLNEVIDRRLGIPISLSVVYIDIGRRLGLPLRGVSFPGHFLVKCTLHAGVVVLDPFAKGASLSAQALCERLDAGTEDTAGQDTGRLKAVLQAASTAEILARMLRNLKAIHRQRGDMSRALWAADRILTLMPESGAAYRERGSIYLELECFRAALADFSRYAELAPAAAAAEGVRSTIADLRNRAARLN